MDNGGACGQDATTPGDLLCPAPNQPVAADRHYAASVIDIAARWREFENTLHAKGLDWGLHHAPAQLRHARSTGHPRGARVEHLLPADYRAFVSEVGYPVVGFRYYDRAGISFLPPEVMASM